MTNSTQKLLESQLQNSRNTEKLHKKTITKMATAALKQIPRSDLIELLIKKKIIQKDWLQKGNKYKLKESESDMRCQND